MSSLIMSVTSQYHLGSAKTETKNQTKKQQTNRKV